MICFRNRGIQRLIFDNIRLSNYKNYSFNMADTGDIAETSQSILKPPKGMRDIEPAQAWQRKHIFKTITDCFKRHKAQPLHTPVLVKREILVGKYGEEAKLIYDLEENNEEPLSLRYDLTVPFAIHLAQNKLETMVRYEIGKVYRRDNPSIARGRFREFYQCDIDFAGRFDLMKADSECLLILCEILSSLQLPYSFRIKINHREILNGMFRVCGVPQEKFKTICSSVDKLDKMTWQEVKQEMSNEKGLDPQVADKIGTYVGRSGGLPLVEELLTSDLAKDESARRGLEEMKILYTRTECKSKSDNLSFDLSLARGLDYYTGLIFEATLKGDVDVGSVAAGGRYDNLVSSLLDDPNYNVPCVGLSIGIERIFAIMESQKKHYEKLSEAPIHCCIGSIGKNMSEHRDKIVDMLRERGVRVSDIPKEVVKPLVLYQTCEKEEAPFAVFFGPKDIENKAVCLRNLSTRGDDKVAIEELPDHLANRLCLEEPQVQPVCFNKTFHKNTDVIESDQRDHLVRVITDCFEAHGARPIDTPDCERRELFFDKYGENTESIFNFKDQGGEALSLRYDLTVPFARYLAQNKIQAMKRYQIGKVYCRASSSNRSKFQECYQGDIDFAGKGDPMIQESECLKIMCEIFDSLDLPYSFQIKINHCEILNGIFRICGVPNENFSTVCSSLDKLDRMSWEEVKQEMCNEKGLDTQVADKIRVYVSRSGSLPLLEELLSSDLAKDASARRGLEELQLLYTKARCKNISENLSFDLSLAPGLNYYTGVIFKAVFKRDVDVSGIASGGRYDNLVSNLLDNPNYSVPCIGLSVGIDRILKIIESQQK